MLPLLNGSRLASAQRRIAAQAILVGAWTLVWSMGNLLSAQGVTTFRAGVDLVPMRVSVATRDGQPVLDLTRDDFLVLDRGRPAEIGAFAKVAPTIAAQLLIDDCPRITPHEDAVRALARDFLGSIRGGDRAAIATYISRGTPFTDDLRLLAAGLDTAFRGHRPADCDTWYSWTGLDMARARSNGPLDRMFGPDGSLWHAPGYLEWSSGVSAEVRTIIVASSGMDYRGSDTERPEVAPAATSGPLVADIMRKTVRSSVVVFGFGFEGTRDDKRLQKLASDSGGWFVQPKRNTDLAAEITHIMTDLRGRYLIGFVPTVFDGEDHKLEVRVKRPGLTVRTRAFYQPPAPK